jgi:hypothetical protein
MRRELLRQMEDELLRPAAAAADGDGGAEVFRLLLRPAVAGEGTRGASVAVTAAGDVLAVEHSPAGLAAAAAARLGSLVPGRSWIAVPDSDGHGDPDGRRDSDSHGGPSSPGGGGFGGGPCRPGSARPAH